MSENKYSLICFTFTGTLNQLHFMLFIHLSSHFIFQFLHVVSMEYACLLDQRQTRGAMILLQLATHRLNRRICAAWVSTLLEAAWHVLGCTGLTRRGDAAICMPIAQSTADEVDRCCLFYANRYYYYYYERSYGTGVWPTMYGRTPVRETNLNWGGSSYGPILHVKILNTVLQYNVY